MLLKADMYEEIVAQVADFVDGFWSKLVREIIFRVQEEGLDADTAFR